MIGVGMGLVALLVIPAGFVLAWWLVRQLERKAAAEGRGYADPFADPQRMRRPHPSTQPPARADSGALDDAPAEVIAALAQQVASRRPDNT